MLESLEAVISLDARGFQQQLSSTAGVIKGVFDDINKQKLDFSKIASEGVFSTNWTPILSKLFSTANLISFFSAMAATGIITAVHTQADVKKTEGQVKVPTSVEGSDFGGAAIDIINAIPGLDASVGDVVDALARMSQITGNFDDAQSTVLALGQAAFITKTKISDLIMPLIQFLGSAGAKTKDDIIITIDNLKTSSQLAGITMTDMVSQLDEFVTTASSMHVGIDGINKAIVDFGSWSEKGHLSEAKGLLDQMTTNLTDMEASIKTSGVNSDEFAKLLEKGPNSVLEKMLDRSKSISASLDTSMLHAVLGVNAAYVLGLKHFDENKQQILNNSKLIKTDLNSAVNDLNANSKKVLSTWDLIKGVVTAITLSLSTFKGSAALTLLLSALGLVAVGGGVGAMGVAGVAGAGITGGLVATLLAALGIGAGAAAGTALSNTKIGQEIGTSKPASAIQDFLYPLIDKMTGMNTQSNITITQNYNANVSGNDSKNVAASNLKDMKDGIDNVIYNAGTQGTSSPFSNKSH